MKPLDAHRHPALAVDLVILTITEGQLAALVMPRDYEASGDAFALPGGFVHYGHSLDETVRRVLNEKTGLGHVAPHIAIEQLATYGAPLRDPRGHVVSVAYLAMVLEADLPHIQLLKGLQFAEVKVDWPGEVGGPASVVSKGKLLELAFDHATILGDTVKRLRGKIDYSLIAFDFLPARFSLRQVQDVHEAILGRPLLKPAFRRKLLDRDILRDTGLKESGSAFRPAALFELKPSPLE